MFAQMGALGHQTEEHTHTYRGSMHSLYESDEDDEMGLQPNNDINVDLVPCIEPCIDDDGNRIEGQTHSCKNGQCKRLIFNVSGHIFETQLGTLSRYPTTKLGNPKKRKRFWDPVKEQYYLDRHAPSFQAILYYFQSGGRLYRPEEIPEDIFMHELEFYELEQRIVKDFKLTNGFLPDPVLVLPENPVKKIIWETFESPGSSMFAKALGIFSLFAIVVSIGNFCLESLPEFSENICINISSYNDTEWVEAQNYSNPFFIVECSCVTWFTIELILRFASCPSKKRFVRKLMNIFDIGAVVPFYVILSVVLVTGTCDHSQKTGLSIVFLRVLRLFRAFRIMKLTKHSRGMQILGLTIKQSMSELGLFLVFLGISAVLFSATMYFADVYDTNSKNILSIPDGLWFTIVTMTTVGYGDVVPQGLVGKLVGTACLISGIITIALLVPVVVMNFSKYYVHERKPSG